MEACDIRDTSCQRATADVAACLRDAGDAASVPVTVVDAESFVERRIAEADEGDPTERDIDIGLSLLGLSAPPEERQQTLREYYDTVGAFYSPSEDAVTVLDHGYPLDGPGAVLLLLHEMIHAMQGADDSGDDDTYPSTYDGRLARSAMVEGEAILYQDLATLDGWGRSRNIAWGDIFRQYKTREWDEAPDDTSVYDFAWRRFPYAFGGDYVNRAWRDGGNTRVRQILSNPPRSARQVIAGYDAGSAGSTEEPAEVGMPLIPDELELLAARRLGAWVVGVWRPLIEPDNERPAFDANSGFVGDVLTIFRHRSTGDITTFWRLRYDRPEQATRIASTLDRFSRFIIVVIDRDVVVAASSSGVPSESFLSALDWGPAPAEDFTAVDDDAAAASSREAITCTMHLATDEDHAAR